MISPSQFKVAMGQLDSLLEYDINGVEVNKETYSYLNSEANGTWGKATLVVGNAVFSENYYIKKGLSKLAQTKSFYLGKLITTTNFDYGYNHTLQPKFVSTLHSSGLNTAKYFAYTSDSWFGTAINQYHANKNIITPFQEVSIDNSQDIAGTITEYSAYSSAGNFLGVGGISTPGSVIRPSKIQKYNYNPAGAPNTIPNGWADEMYMHSYDASGPVKETQNVGWDYTTYTYSGKRETSSKFLSHDNQTTYYPNSHVTKEVIAIDGTKVNHEYDSLFRLKRKTYIPSNVTQEYTYQYLAHPTLAMVTFEKMTVPPSDARSMLSVVEKAHYFDKFGRGVATIQIKGSPTQKDVITSTEYDNYSRPIKNYLPVETTFSDGTYVAIQAGWKYNEVTYETSPLARAKTITPADWYPTTNEYGFNTVSDGLHEPVNTLYKETTIDANNNKTMVFTDFKGRKILERKTSQTDNAIDRHDTRYSYDEKNRLIKVLPPDVLVSNTNLTYSYTYDAEDKMLSKKVPQSGTMSMIYNDKDLVIGTQDANLLAQGKWIVSNYDGYGRLFQSGMSTTAPNPSLSVNSYGQLLQEKGYGSSGINLGKQVYDKKAILESANFLEATMTYNPLGQLATVNGNNIKNLQLNSTLATYTYDLVNNMVESNTSILGWQAKTERTYDHRGRSIDDMVSYINGGTNINAHVSKKAYNHRNELITALQGKTGLSGVNEYLQKVDFTYKTNGLLTGINQALTNSANSITNCTTPAPNAEALDSYDKKDLFALTLDYDQSSVPTTATRKNGEIAAETWQYKGYLAQSYGHTYDAHGRLTATKHYQGSANLGLYDQAQTYDKRGNITNLKRKGVYGTTCATPITIDSLTYVFDNTTNRIAKITDNAPCLQNYLLPPTISGNANIQVLQNIYIDSTVVDCSANLTLSAGSGVIIKKSLKVNNTCGLTNITVNKDGCMAQPYFTPGFTQTSLNGTYGYDTNGNMTFDPNKGINITYNHLDLPRLITWANGNQIRHTYDATGMLLRKEIMRGSTVVQDRYYIGPMEWISDTLQVINHSQGQFIKEGNAYTKYYHINDHLGNTRVVYSDKNNDGAIQYATEVGQSTQYYPFGLEHNVAAYSKTSTNDYLYNGVRQESAWDLNWSVTPYRTYDKSIARWHQVDPKAEASAHVSPYVAMDNNPISMADPMGDIPTGRPGIMDHLAHIGLGMLYNWLGASPGDGNPSTVSGSMRGNWFPMPEQVVLTDWYRDPKTGEEFWTPDRGAIDGLDWLGENRNVKGKYGDVYHEQNVVVGSGGSSYSNYAMTTLGIGTDALGGLGSGMGKMGGTFRFTNGAYNGNSISLRHYASGWRGGSVAQIRTFNMGSAGKILAFAGNGVTVGLGLYDIRTNYVNEGGFKVESQKAVGRLGGSLAGGTIGAYIGSLGFGIGAIPGAILGSTIGGYFGSRGGERIVESIQP